MNLHIKGTIGGQSNASPLTALGRRQVGVSAPTPAAAPCVLKHTLTRAALKHPQAAALGTYLARLHPSLAGSGSQQLVHTSTAVRAVDTAAIALQQFPVGVRTAMLVLPTAFAPRG
jgi:broad specificity phosphatase PhoE